MTDFEGIQLSEEEREVFAENEIYDLEQLLKKSYRQIAQMIGEEKAKSLEDSLIDKGLSFINSRRKSLKCF